MRVAPYGSWASPITSDLITKSSVGLGSIVVDGTAVYWLEQRPLEGGRNVIVCRSSSGETFDVTPAPFNVRSLAHEYGGGAYTVHDGIVYFVNYKDQQIYKQRVGAAPEQVTSLPHMHYADIVVDAKRNRLVCVQEDHSTAGQEAITTLSSVSLKDGSVEMIIAGNDFYAYPRFSPNGMFMSWMSWNHPNMPWDESMVWCGNVAADGSLSNMRLIAGGPGESVFQPQWSPAGELYYISDRSGWWNIYRHTDYEGEQDVCRMNAEFGFPLWNFAMSSYAFASGERIICTYGDKGTWRLAALNTTGEQLENFNLPYTEFSTIKAAAGKAYFRAGSPTQSACIAELDLKSKQVTVLKKSDDVNVDEGYISAGQTIEFDTTDGKKAYAFFYPPRNKDFKPAEGELPPLLVKSHGGPTSETTNTLNLSTQYWTSRGFAVVDVNYGGSTGYGREYRSRLYSSWGVVDVDDCVNAAKFLADKKLVDKNMLAIRGGSAGGYTTLCALTFRDAFKAGASYYGVSDLEALATDTHKFESRYLDRLVGPYPAAKQIYEERSPINFVSKLRCPAIFLQGLEDKVVPPNQSEKMVNAMKKAGVPVAYVTFEGEQHGFRKAENIKRSLDAELYFYSQIFGFKPSDQIEPVAIDNLHKEPVR